MSTTIRELITKLGVDADDAGVRRFGVGIDRLKRSMGGVVGFAGKVVGALTLITGAFGAREVLDTIQNYERLREQLRTVVGDVDEAGARFDELTKFAASTPFQLDGITEAFIQMQAVGLKPTIEDMKDVGDFAAAFGKDITEFAGAVVGATTGETERLKQFGVVARVEGQKLKVTFDGQTKVIKRDSESIKKFLLDMARTRFAGSMERQSKTLGGAISTLKDNIAGLIFQLGESGLRKALTGLVMDLTGMTTSAEDAVKVLGTKLAGAVEKLREKLPEIRDAIRDIIDKTDAFIERIGGFERVVQIVEGVAVSFAALKGLSFLSALVPLIQGLIAIVGGVSLAAFAEFAAIALAVVAALAALFFIGQDIVTFFQGGDSALGRFIERFRSSEGILGNFAKQFAAIGEIVTSVANIALPIFQRAGAIAFRVLRIGVTVLGALLQGLWDNIIAPLGEFIGGFWLAIFEGVRDFFKTFGVDIVGVFDTIFDTIFDAVERVLGAVENLLGIGGEAISIGEGLTPALAGAQGRAAAPIAGTPSQATGAQGPGAGMTVGGDTNQITINAQNLDEKQLADELDKRLTARDKAKARQTRERFRGAEA